MSKTYRNIFPESILYKILREADNKINHEEFNPRGPHRAIVLEVCKVPFNPDIHGLRGNNKVVWKGMGNDNFYKDEEKQSLQNNDGTISCIVDKTANNKYYLPYPKGYIRAYVDGLDVGMPFEFCRVFRPAEDIPDAINAIHRGDMINVEFDDPIHFSQGKWGGKLPESVNPDNLPVGLEWETVDSYFGGVDNQNIPSEPFKDIIVERPIGEEIDELSNAVVLAWPVDSTQKYITSEFGVPRTGRIHKGTDIRAPEGTIVLAAGNGQVRTAQFTDTTFSYFIEIEHSGYMTRYFHLGSNLQVYPGMYVQKGQAIGQVGPKDKVSSGPHLHFEVRKVNQGQERTNGIALAALNPINNNTAIIKVYS